MTPSELVWTKDVPKETGWYWVKMVHWNRIVETVVRVFEWPGQKGLLMFQSGKSGGWEDSGIYEMKSASMWSGPIRKPVEEK